MNNLEAFVQKIENFDTLSSGERIKYFVYFLTQGNDNWIQLMCHLI